MVKIFAGFILIYFIIIGNPLIGQEIHFIDKIPVSQKECIIEMDSGIAILPGDFFIICDGRAGDLKIFDRNGKYIKKFGRRGEGPDEFATPRLYDYSDSNILINDWRKNKIFVYTIINDLELKLKEEFLGTCFDSKILSDGYLISGSKADKKENWYRLYIEYPRNREYSFLLTTEEMFNIQAEGMFISNSNQLEEQANIGHRAYCDYLGDHVYAAWEGLLSIIQLNTNTRKITRYKEKSPLYKKPVISNELVLAKKERNQNKYTQELNKYSMIRKLFVSNKYIGIVYMNYDSKSDMLNPIVQIYSLDGKFLVEKKLENITYPNNLLSMYYDKTNNILYALSLMINEQSESQYTLVRYGIR